jgi:hypothetical protein
MAKQSQENFRMKMFSNSGTISIVNYLNGIESSKVNARRNFNKIIITTKNNILIYLEGHPNNYLIISDKYFIYHLLFTRK